MKLLDFKRIAKEDFEEEYQDLIEKLAFPINSVFEQLRIGLNRNLDFTNLNQEVITLKVTTVTGTPKTQTQFKTNLRNRLLGIACIAATNTQNPATYPVSAPFASYSQEANIVTIRNVTGLQDNQEYELVFITYGN